MIVAVAPRMYRIYIMMDSITRKVIGCAASSSVHCGIAIVAKTHETQNTVHASLPSRPGFCRADTNVGMDPRKTTLWDVMIASVGLLKICQSIMPRTAPARQNLSSFVQPAVPYLRVRNTTIHTPITAPMIWPLTASLATIPASVMRSEEHTSELQSQFHFV